MQTNEANHELPEIDFALFGNYPIQFRQYLSERNYAENTIRQYLSCIGSLAEMMKADGITVGDLDEAQAVALIAKTGWKGRRMVYATFILKVFCPVSGRSGSRQASVAADGQGNREGGIETGL
jgi:hypothetical protein